MTHRAPNHPHPDPPPSWGRGKRVSTMSRSTLPPLRVACGGGMGWGVLQGRSVGRTIENRTSGEAPMTSRYEEIHRRSLSDPEGFWAEAAAAIDWERRWDS